MRAARAFRMRSVAGGVLNESHKSSRAQPPFQTAGHGAVRLSGYPFARLHVRKVCVVNGSRNTLVAVASPGCIARKIGALRKVADRHRQVEVASSIPLRERALRHVTAWRRVRKLPVRTGSGEGRGPTSRPRTSTSAASPAATRPRARRARTTRARGSAPATAPLAAPAATWTPAASPETRARATRARSVATVDATRGRRSADRTQPVVESAG